MIALPSHSAVRRYAVFAAFSVAIAALVPAFASDEKGLLERVGKAEQLVFGAQHSDKPLHQRIRDLEQQTIAGTNSGALTNRMDALEKTINGTVSPSPSKAGSKTARSAGNAKNSRQTAKGPSRSATANAAPKPVPTTTSEYMPPIAPHLDPGGPAAPSTSATTANATPAGTNTPEVDEILRKGTAAFQSGNTTEAEKDFKDVLVKSPFNSNASYNLGAIAESKGDLAGALGNYRTALIGSPNDKQIQEAIAQIEGQIAAQANPTFTNPLARTANGGTVLQGNASDFGLYGGNKGYGLSGATNGMAMHGQAAQIPPIPGGVGSAAFPAGTTASANSSPFRSPAQAFTPQYGVTAAGGVAVASTVARMALRYGVRGGAFSPTSLMGALHCPICRLLK